MNYKFGSLNQNPDFNTDERNSQIDEDKDCVVVIHDTWEKKQKDFQPFSTRGRQGNIDL